MWRPDPHAQPAPELLSGSVWPRGQGLQLARILDEGASTMSSQAMAVAGLAALLAYAWCLWRRFPDRPGEARYPWRHAAIFVAGIVGLWVATSGTLHALGRWSLAAHMGQHMLLFAYVPPLLVAGWPAQFIATRSGRGAPGARAPCAGREGRGSTSLLAATAVHSMVMWFWHHPAAITSTLLDDRLQLAMHASFVLSGVWFWMALTDQVRKGAAGAGTPLLALVSIMMQMGLLGALLTFSPRVLYAVCSERAPLLGLEPLSDQQLAGLIMWVPACLPYLLGALWLMQYWFAGRAAREAQH